ncbi:hypothetical protein EDC04DRAFT_507820 [Pisolithus marmoratus]|nr:hypothetical protein EDC04DRAFT_507820 [Pisolithus marmoratus]
MAVLIWNHFNREYLETPSAVLRRFADLHQCLVFLRGPWTIVIPAMRWILVSLDPGSPPLRALAMGALNRTGPHEPASANGEPNMSRQRSQANPRGPVGPTLFNAQNMVGGAQPSNSPAIAGARSNRLSPVRFTDHIANMRNQREEGGRRRNSTLGHSRPNANLTPRPENIVVDDEPALRRPFGGGILQRLANFQRSSDSNSSSLSQPGTRVVPPPLGARPALTRHRRIIPPDPIDDDDRPPSMNRNSITPVPTFEHARRQPTAWHPFVSGGRDSERPGVMPGSTTLPARESAPLTSLGEHTFRHQAHWQRAQPDRGGAPMQRMHRPVRWRSMVSRRNFGASDYIVSRSDVL